MKHRIVAFEDLIAPLSNGKILLLVECLNIEGCEQPGIMGELSELLNLGYGEDYDDWEDFLNFGFVLLEWENKPEQETEANLMIDYLRNDKFQELVQADLFIDGTYMDTSWSGDPEVWDIGQLEKKSDKSVVIRFPVEKINRRKEPK